MNSRATSNRVLIVNTIAFTACFAVWTMYGVLITFLVDNKVLAIDKGQIGWLLGVPVLTGSIFRLPVGMLTEKYGGKPVYIGVMLVAAVSVYLTSFANTYGQFLLGGLFFGLSGASFAVGIAYTSAFFPKQSQGTALGVFGMGNAGSAATTVFGPMLLQSYTNGGQNIEGWRRFPQLYALLLVAMSVLFALSTVNKKDANATQKTMGQMLKPLKDVRVWRFGLYYFLVFGAFVALAQWLVPYYLNVYGLSLASAGLLAAVFSFPSGVIRALGGWASDKFGARATMYWVLGSCCVLFAMLIAPRMNIESPGEGIMADKPGVVASVSANEIVVDAKKYALTVPVVEDHDAEGTLVWPKVRAWHEPAVQAGQKVKRKEVLARGVTRIYFQANIVVFTVLVFLAGIMMGIGKAAVYKHIPEYFPNDVGVVGGIVGVIGGLGGFVCPILFGYMLKGTALWTSCWLFLGLLSVICITWMHMVVLRMTKDKGIEAAHQ